MQTVQLLQMMEVEKVVQRGAARGALAQQAAQAPPVRLAPLVQGAAHATV